MSATPETSTLKSRRKLPTLEDQLARLERDAELVRVKLREERKAAMAQLGEAVLAEAKEKPELWATIEDLVSRRLSAKGSAATIRKLMVVG